MSQTFPKFNRPVTLLLLTGALGCTDIEPAPRADQGDGASADDESTGEPAAELDEDEVLALGMDYADELEKMTDMPELSETHSDAASVQVWGSADLAELFRGINPDDPTQEITFDEGALFVKEHFDVAGDYVGLTMMYKGPEGYNEAGNDWFWARVRGEEVTHSGKVDFCLDCHAAAHNTDFVVGFAKSE
jgi:hypothetical protein